MFKARTRRRRTFFGLVVVALAALAIVVSQAFAGPGSVTAPIQKHNGFCGADTGQKTIGSVTFTRIDKSTMRIVLQFTKGEPSTKYEVFLFDSDCNVLDELAFVKTSSTGTGKWTFTTSTFGQQSFFLDPFDGNFANDSPIVKLP
jgi:hypothetical protein